jgi:hypothetical protein
MFFYVGGWIKDIVQHAAAIDEVCAAGQIGRERLIQVDDDIGAFKVAVIYRPDLLHSQQPEKGRVADEILARGNRK